MTNALWLMLVQALLGGFDTLYYHEYRARLPAGGARTRPELVVHALRDFVYAILFISLPFFDWRGTWALVLGALIVIEIVLTMTDFVLEVGTRGPAGVAAGERVTHGLMAIVYGAVLACLAPVLLAWFRAPSALALGARNVPPGLCTTLLVLGAGVALSGARDLYAACGLPGGDYPYQRR